MVNEQELSQESPEEKPKNTIVLTRRIQLNFNEEDAGIRKELWTKLYNWQHIVHKAANMIFTNLYLQDNIKEAIYLEEELKMKLTARYKKNPENKKEMIEVEPTGMLNTSRTNSTYRFISSKFKGEIPMSIMTALNMQLASVYSKESKKYYTGELSLRNYKRDMPIPFETAGLQNIMECNKYGDYSFNLYDIPFKTYFGKDRDDKKLIWQRSLQGEYKLCNSWIQLKDKKIFLLAAFEFEKQKLTFTKEQQAIAILSFEAPIVLQIGKTEINIGGKEEYLHHRLSIQGQMRKCQRAAKFGRAQKGRTIRMKSLERFSEWEKNYITNRIHKYSNNLIKLCIQYKCGTLVLKNQTQTEEEAKENPFVLRNWSYYQLKEKIQYKAARVGLELIIE